MAVRAFPYIVVLSAVILTLAKAFLTDGASRHVDTQWLYSASKCIWMKFSPYDVEQFRFCWQENTKGMPFAPFVFPPVLFPIILPMGGMTFESAKFYIDVLNAIAIILVAGALWWISGIASQTGWRRIFSGILLSLGVSVGGISGAAFVGQPTIFVLLGICLLYLGIEKKLPVLFVIGTVLSLIKPQVSLLFLAWIWMVRGTQMGMAKAASILGVLIILLLVTTLDGNFLPDYLQSLEIHRQSEVSALASHEGLYGLTGLLERWKVEPQVILPVVFSVFGAAAIAGWVFSQPMENPMTAIHAGVSLIGVFVFAVKAYDIATSALIFALVVHLPLRMQAIVFLPLLVIWRPALISLISISIPDPVAITLVELSVVWISVVLIVGGLRQWGGNSS